ncbi:hypothetical protein BO70DRAFT_429628 [Aspergillus heteromorphus CBS 117.55]|uniref:Microbial-type PARG catalytic domain-containing protein n=1 Tax=Aspergillus heteromorphus CBS 117.55 TaxID=1448321 RepID=A0A317W5J6_9EURO|nr:uncharacterized protein BO70DRAFT_429628 [Aspergillus heteromorphus CBS 117.55]PWY80602.1 hypothetical protein BO70DRAFT_429628 [Aspergillus heteromorphus CBS 117.55]
MSLKMMKSTKTNQRVTRPQRRIHRPVTTSGGVKAIKARLPPRILRRTTARRSITDGTMLHQLLLVKQPSLAQAHGDRSQTSNDRSNRRVQLQVGNSLLHGHHNMQTLGHGNRPRLPQRHGNIHRLPQLYGNRPPRLRRRNGNRPQLPRRHGNMVQIIMPLNGAMAQEEALCYRSSLSLTLKRRYYQIGGRNAIYSPTVAVFYENFTPGHALMNLQKPELLPVVSVISVAALEGPEVDDTTFPPISGYKKHRKVILGALGCGAFANPSAAVAECWGEVPREGEFNGWWERVFFAVLDDAAKGTQGGSNFDVFRERLHGLRI